MRSSPSVRPDPFILAARPVAHRGLHGNGRVENSRAAFAAAIAAGQGVELDVQATRDGEAVVFHDYALDRLTAERGDVAARTVAQLQALHLAGTDEAIPSLPEVLVLVAGRVPLLIELKAPSRHVDPLCRAVARALSEYPGPVGVMSFNPEVGRWFARHDPLVLRGLVVSEQGKAGLRGRIERRLGLLRAKADFLACDVRDLPSIFVAAVRARGLPVLTWTVRSEADRARAAACADQIIHELDRR